MSEPSTGPRSKAELLERMRAGREEWDALIAQIPDSARTEPALPGGWSVKDLIAHIAAYENWTAAQIRAANEGRAPTDRELYGVEEMPPDPEGWLTIFALRLSPSPAQAGQLGPDVSNDERTSQVEVPRW